MQEAEARLMCIIPLSLGLIFILLYLAFRNVLDSMPWSCSATCSRCRWAASGPCCLTGTNFSISAAVGFISLFGVAIMDGLLLISYFNQLRFQGLPLHEAIMRGGRETGPPGDDDRL